MVDILYQNIDQVPQLADIVHKLRDHYFSLVTLVLAAAKNLDVNVLKCLVRSVLTEHQNTFNFNVQHHINALDRIELVDQLFDFLTDRHFIGYLNYTLLKEISDLTKDSELKKKFEEYEEEYKELLNSSSFKCLIGMFESYPHYHPVTAVGLPKMTVCLDHPWTERSVYTFHEYFNNRFPWTNSLAADEYSTNCILITYAILPFVLPDVMRDLTKPAIIQELKDNGITIVQLPQEQGIVYIHMCNMLY